MPDVPEGMVWRSTGRVERLRAETVTTVDQLVHVTNELVRALERLIEPVDVLRGLDPDDVVSLNARFAELELARQALDAAGELERDWSKLPPPG